jgi:hypothetical protein
MLKRTFVSFAALGVFTVLAFGSKKPDSTDFSSWEESLEQLEQSTTTTDAGSTDAGASAPSGGSLSDNVAACKYYVETYNGLSCLQSAGIQLNADDVCSAGLNMSPLDMRDYYKCMADNSKCNGNIPDMAGVSGCTLPSM